MHATRKTWQNILYIVVLMAAVCLLFQWYSTANRQRIEHQNLNYALDSSRQTAARINSEFDNALLRVRNYAYLLSSDQGAPEITAERLKGMELHSSFDAIRFTNAEGVNLTSSGQTSNSLDRNYYIRGMQGESGVEILRSRLTDQMMTVSYALSLIHI